ncbi:MAG: ZIP family metal transporter [Parcubacteria group bacterium]|nr:ZIP family metal transporter [Parcubacteria group bacterium]
MTLFFTILLSAFTISIISILGIFALFLKEKLLNKILLILVGLSAGAMMGGAFLHLIPEAVEKMEDSVLPYLLVVVGFTLFFLMEKILHWRHCHKGKCSVHTFGYLNIIGDSVHNFIDGLILAAAFIIDINLGIITAITIALHEVPQEMGDFGVLIYAGFKKTKALVLNYIAASTIILGAMLGYFLGGAPNFINYLLPFAAGGFIYIASADLLPELKKETSWKKFLPSFIFFLLGFGLMLALRLFME